MVSKTVANTLVWDMTRIFRISYKKAVADGGIGNDGALHNAPPHHI